MDVGAFLRKLNVYIVDEVLMVLLTNVNNTLVLYCWDVRQKMCSLRSSIYFLETCDKKVVL